MKIVIFIVLLCSLVVFAQENETTEDQQAKVTDETTQADVPPGEFIYQPQGRRDPFWDLSKGEKAKTEREELEGIAGLLIDELKLEGIVFSKGKYTALLSGPSNAEPPFSVTVGVNVYDGVIVKIDNNSVVFKKILTMPLGGKKEKFETKWLNPEQEARRK
jgi:Tfp pilus assembly protein PilP